jgi:hypothetical protein
MDRLPQELVERVCSFLPKDDLKKVLTMTSKFRYAAERCSGIFEEFTINSSGADIFLALYSGHRLQYLRELEFRPSLPEKSHEELRSCRETATELNDKNIAFTKQIVLLFKTLSSVEQLAEVRQISGNYRLRIYGPVSRSELSSVCDHHLFVSWRLRLLNPAQLPLIRSVRSFEVHNSATVYNDGSGWEPRLDLRFSVDMVTKFPNLEFLHLQTGGFEWHSTLEEEEPGQHYTRDWEGPRRDARHDFARALSSSAVDIPKPLKRVSLDFLYPLDRTLEIHHGKALPDLVDPVARDPFSSSLQIITTSLRELRIRAMVDESLFWPDNETNTFGPNLEIFEVMFHIARPDGKWFFSGPEGEGCNTSGYRVTSKHYPPFETSKLDLEMDSLREERPFHSSGNANLQFRIVPNDDNLNPLLEGFARTANRMWRLQEAMIWTPLTWHVPESCKDEFGRHQITESELLWGIAYAGPDRPANRNSCRQIEWMVGEWRPNQDLHKLFQQIGCEQHGTDVKEVWTEDVYGASPAAREWADDFMFSNDPGRIPLKD